MFSGSLLIPNDIIITETLNISNKNISLIGNGATLTKSTDGAALNISGSFQESFSVTSNTVSAGSTILTLSSAPSYQKGDVIKIISDDRYNNRRSNSSLMGEFGVVRSVTGNAVTLTSKLVYIDQMTVNIRVAKLNNYKTTVSGLKFRTPTSRSVQIVLNSLLYPVLTDLQCDINNAQFLEIRSCYGYNIRDCVFTNLTDEPDDGIYGYAINDHSGYGGSVNNCMFHNMRHAYTTNARNPTTPVEFTDYGEAMFINLNGCSALGSSGASYSTHENGYGIIFNGCKSIGGFAGGFTARNTNTVFNNCYVNGLTGFSVYNFEETNAVGDVHFNNCYASCHSYGFYATPSDSFQKTRNIHISGGYFKSVATVVWNLNDVEISINGRPVIETLSDTGTVAVYRSIVDIDSLKVISNIISGNKGTFSLQGGSTVTATNLEFIKNATGGNWYIATANVSASPSNNNEFIVFNLLTKNYNIDPNNMFLGNYFSKKLAKLINSANGTGSARISYDATTELTLKTESLDPNVLHMLGNATSLIISPPVAEQHGQTLSILNRSSAPISLPSNVQSQKGRINQNTVVNLSYRASDTWVETSRTSAVENNSRNISSAATELIYTNSIYVIPTGLETQTLTSSMLPNVGDVVSLINLSSNSHNIGFTVQGLTNTSITEIPPLTTFDMYYTGVVWRVKNRYTQSL